jgi:hypothetical protein
MGPALSDVDTSISRKETKNICIDAPAETPKEKY